MFFLYLGIFILLTVLITAFRKYKKEITELCNRKEHPFLFMYGFSIFIIELTGTVLLRFHGLKKQSGLSSLDKKIMMLNPGSKINDSVFLTTRAKQISISITALLLFSILGLIYTGNKLINPTSAVSALPRPTDGSDETSYSLQVDMEDYSGMVDINVEKKHYTIEEIYDLIQSYKTELLTILLAGNNSFDQIDQPLYFPSAIGTENISLDWVPEDTSLIDISGNLIGENISPDGTFTNVYVTMTLDEITSSMVIGMTLFPPASTYQEILQTEISNYIKQNSSPYSDYVLLPDTISEKGILFFFPSENNDIIFALLGFLGTLILFIISYKDIDNKISARNRQMMQDYPEIVSKLLLLCNAGLTIQNSLKKIVEDYKSANNIKKRFAYEELSITVNSLQTGSSERGAYSEFGKRCALMPYIKLGALLEQNLSKGTAELRYHLSAEMRDAFETHRSEIISRSKTAETKLLFPMIIILVIIMALIIFPSFSKI